MGAFSGRILQSAVSRILERGSTVGSIFVSPGAGQVLVDTDELDRGIYNVACYIMTNVAATVDILHRDATNATNISQIRVFTSTINEYYLFPSPIRILADERIRLDLIDAVVGTIQGVIYAAPLD